MFIANASGKGVEMFTYIWRYSSNLNGQWSSYIATTNGTLIISNAKEHDMGYYQCVVTNEYGDNATSNLVYLTVQSM